MGMTKLDLLKNVENIDLGSAVSELEYRFSPEPNSSLPLLHILAASLLLRLRVFHYSIMGLFWQKKHKKTKKNTIEFHYTLYVT